jgi:hypothetical protein
MIGMPKLIARVALAALLGVALAGAAPAMASAAETISKQDAHAIGVAAYLYFYSPVAMDMTRKQATNVARPDGIHAPMNRFANLTAFPPVLTGKWNRPRLMRESAADAIGAIGHAAPVRGRIGCGQARSRRLRVASATGGGSLPAIINTPRIRLRCWEAADRGAFAAMHADPEVMLDYGGPINRVESDA